MPDLSMTYGELVPGQLKALLSNHKQTTFIDLGSGCGHLCFEACTLTQFSHIIGLELHPERLAQALSLKKTNKDLMARCEFFSHDLFYPFEAIPSPAVAYLCATCFTSTLLQSLGWWLTAHPLIESIITLKPLPLDADCWCLSKTGLLLCTWDSSVFYQYDKTP